MLGAAYGEGTVDVWDVSAHDGTLKLLEEIPVGGTPGPVAGRQDSPRKNFHLPPAPSPKAVQILQQAVTY